MKRCRFIFSTEVTELEDIKSYTEHVLILLKILALKYFFSSIFYLSQSGNPCSVLTEIKWESGKDLMKRLCQTQ